MRSWTRVPGVPRRDARHSGALQHSDGGSARSGLLEPVADGVTQALSRGEDGDDVVGAGGVGVTQRPVELAGVGDEVVVEVEQRHLVPVPLEPGGELRIIVPDAARYLQAYCRPDLDGFRELAVPDPFPDDLPTRMDVINHIFHQWGEHRWAYDFETLSLRLRTAGFGTIEQVGYQRSLLPALAQDRDVHAPYSLYVDAVKPA